MGRKSHHKIDDLHNKWGDMAQKITQGRWEATENNCSKSNKAELDDVMVELA